MAIVKMIDICEKIGSGATPRGGKEAYCDEGISLVRSQNVLDFAFSRDGLAHINDEQAQKLNNVEVHEGDVLLNITGDSVARACMMDSVFLPARVNQHVAIVRGKENKVINSFILYFLQWRKGYLLQLASAGATRNALTKGMIEQLEINLPSMNEQKKIVAILDSIQQKIQLNQKINDNLELQAAALIARYQTTTDTVITLHDIMDFENGFAFQSSTYLAEGAYRIITIKNVQDGRIDSDGAAYIDSIPPRMKNGCRLHIGDALLSLTGNVGRAGIVCEENLLLNQRVAKIVPHNPDLLPFLYFVYRLPSTKVMLESIAKGTAQLNLSPVETLKLTIPFDHETAIQLSRNLAPVYRAIVVNNQESIALAHTRDSLLPKLMSGEIDVSDIQL